MCTKQNLNKFIGDFLTSNDKDNAELLTLWKSKQTQSKLDKQFKDKDPNAPKRANSSYIFFCTDNRAKILAKNPELSPPDLMKALGAAWKAIKPKDKEKYDKMAVEDKARFEKAMDTFAPKKPKKEAAKTAYIFFCEDNREKIKLKEPGISSVDILRKMGAQWNTLKESGSSDIEKYQKLAADDRVRLGLGTPKVKKQSSGSAKTTAAPKEVAKPAAKGKKAKETKEKEPKKKATKKEKPVVEDEEDEE